MHTAGSDEVDADGNVVLVTLCDQCGRSEDSDVYPNRNLWKQRAIAYPSPAGCGNAPITGHGLDSNGQKLTAPLGKILRIDVNGSNSANGQYGIPHNNPFVSTPGAVKEIYAFGFRNSYRFSFDSRTGDLYVGDVGQNDIEEVNIVVRGGNYGWAIKEGTLFFNHNGNLEG